MKTKEKPKYADPSGSSERLCRVKWIEWVDCSGEKEVMERECEIEFEESKGDCKACRAVTETKGGLGEQDRERRSRFVVASRMLGSAERLW